MDNDSFTNRFINRRLKALADLSGASDKSASDDSVSPMSSPIDLMPWQELGLAGAKGISTAAGALSESAPRILGNEIGSVGPNIKGIIDNEANLPMDQASRLARAKEQGFDTDKTYYHGTKNNIKEFDPNKSQTIPGSFFTEDPNFAEMLINNSSEGKNTIPVKLNTQNLFDPDNENHIKELLNWGKNIPKNKYGLLTPEVLTEKGYYPTPELKNATDAEKFIDKNMLNHPQLGWNGSETDLIRDFLNQTGKSGQYIYENGTKNVHILDPSQIRSVNAAFDPAKKSLSDILAGLAGAWIINSQNNNEDEDKFSQINQILNKK